MEKKEDARRKPRERHDRHDRSQSTTKTLSMAMATTTTTTTVPTVHSPSTTVSTNAMATATMTAARVHGGESKPAVREPTVSVTKQAKIADMTVLESTKGMKRTIMALLCPLLPSLFT